MAQHKNSSSISLVCPYLISMTTFTSTFPSLAFFDLSTMKPKQFTKHLQANLTTYNEDIRSITGASGCPRLKFLTRKLMIEDKDTTLKDIGGGSASIDSTVAAAAAVDGAAALRLCLGAAGGGAAAPMAPEQEAQQPLLPPPAKRPAGGKPQRAVGTRRAWYRLNYCASKGVSPGSRPAACAQQHGARCCAAYSVGRCAACAQETPRERARPARVRAAPRGCRAGPITGQPAGQIKKLKQKWCICVCTRFT